MRSLFKLLQYISIGFLFIVPPQLAFTEEITLVADSWCPYNCDPESDRPGYLIELATKIYGEHDISVRYEILPWQRAISFVREGRYTALVGPGLTETPDFIFPKQPLAHIQHVFFTSLESRWQYTDYASLNNIKLGVIKAYSYGDLLESYIEPNSHDNERLTILHGDDELGRLIGLLNENKINAFVEERSIVEYFLKNSAASPKLRVAGVADEEGIYIAFSPKIKNSKRYAELLAEGVKEMRENGELIQLMNKYSIQEPLNQ